MSCWVRPSDIAELVDVSSSTVWRWCNREEKPLPCVKVNQVIRINTDDFWQWFLCEYKVPRVEKIVDFSADDAGTDHINRLKQEKLY